MQRVAHASVSVAGDEVGSIGRGLLVFLGVRSGDEEADAFYLAEKIVNLRVFPDEDGRLNLSLLDVGGEALVISQFTLYADTRKGRRPSFVDAAPPQIAEVLYRRFAELVEGAGVAVKAGRFQQHMLVELVNDGPVTIMLDSADRERPRRG